MAIALDAGFPVLARPTFATIFNTADSGSITTPGTNRVLVIAVDWALNSTTTVNVDPMAVTATGGLTWTKLKEVAIFTSGNTPTGAAAIFWAFAPSVITAQTFTVSRNSSDGKTQSAVVAVWSLSGASSTQSGVTAGHASGSSTNRFDTISPAAGSWVLGAVSDTGLLGGASLTPQSGCTREVENLDSGNGDTYDFVSYRGAPGGAITVGFTGTDDSVYVALAEIQAAGAVATSRMLASLGVGT